MSCGLIAASDALGAPGADVLDQICDVEDVAADIQSGDWVKVAGDAAGAACGFMGDALAGVVGPEVAGAALSVEVGVTTYHLLNAAAQVACGGLFNGDMVARGAAIEGKRETQVALAVTRKGQCMAYSSGGGLFPWTAVTCSA